MDETIVPGVFDSRSDVVLAGISVVVWFSGALILVFVVITWCVVTILILLLTVVVCPEASDVFPASVDASVALVSSPGKLTGMETDATVGGPVVCKLEIVEISSVACVGVEVFVSVPWTSPGK